MCVLLALESLRWIEEMQRLKSSEMKERGENEEGGTRRRSGVVAAAVWNGSKVSVVVVALSIVVD
jgi:hypothetical protein